MMTAMWSKHAVKKKKENKNYTFLLYVCETVMYSTKDTSRMQSNKNDASRYSHALK